MEDFIIPLTVKYSDVEYDLLVLPIQKNYEIHFKVLDREGNVFTHVPSGTITPILTFGAR